MRTPLTPLVLMVAIAGLFATTSPALAAPDLRTRLPIVVIDSDGPIVDDPKVGARGDPRRGRRYQHAARPAPGL